SEVYHGVGSVLWARSMNHAIDERHVFKSSFPGRIGRDGFAIIVPLMKEHEMLTFATRLAKDIVKDPFEGEQLLATGDITASLRVVAFGSPQATTTDDCLKLVRETLDDLEREQGR